MHDIRAIRDDPTGFDAGLARRNLAPQAAELLALDEARRGAATTAQEAQARRNEASKAIGHAKAKRDDAAAAALMEEVALLKQRLPLLEDEARAADAALGTALAALANIPLGDVPDGVDESGNVERKAWGHKPAFDFTPRDHADLGAALGLDFEGGARLSGARFTVLRGGAARLNRALGQFMLDQHGAHGHEEVAPPLLVRDEAMFGTGQLPKFAEDLFRTEDGRWLIPTAEVSLTNLAAGQILSAAALPTRFTALTPCFRSEAGAAGRDTRGLIRQHQFDKVELVTLCAPEESAAEHERMTLRAESILEALGLPYRRMLLCAGDMGFAARKTFDLEVWLPGQGLYREISSCSDCGEFQARRMEARYRAEGGKPAYLHTLNGSGLAVGRALVAVIENYQEADGGVRVPDVLQPYLGGLTRIGPA